MSFACGIGKVKSHRPLAGIWYYAVEMEMGPEADFGRVGYETTMGLIVVPYCL